VSSDPTDHRADIFGPIRSRNVFEEALERVAHAIKTGLYAAGEHLPSERDLAARLEVSRPTVRAVFTALEEAGYVTLRRGRTGGAYVLDRADRSSDAAARRVASSMGAGLLDALDLRWAVEPTIAELAARRSDGGGVGELARLQELCAAAGGRAYRPADMLFHTELATLAHSPSLALAARDIQVRLTDMFNATPVIEDVLRHSDRQHEAIVAAVGRRDGGEARTAMEEHLAASHAFLEAFLSEP
jgi:DNA-binding FadR family transcriptional regulator